MASNELNCVLNHRYFASSFNTLFRLPTKNMSNICIIDPLCRQSTSDTWFACTKLPVMRKVFPCHDVIRCLFLCIEHLTHWGRVTHICVGNLTIIGRHQAIIWTNAGILLIGPLGRNFSEVQIGIQRFSNNKNWKWRLWNGVHFVSASMC